MPQPEFWDVSCQAVITPISKSDRPGNSTSMQPYPVTFASNRFSKQRTLIIGNDRTAFEEILSVVNRACSQAEIFTARDYPTALELIEQIQPQRIIADLESPKLAPNSSRTEAVRLVKQLLNSYWHPNIVVLGDNLDSLTHLQTVIKNYRGGFAASEKSCSPSDLACYIDLVEWGMVYPPETLKPYPKFQVKWLKLLYLRYREGSNDRAIAAKLRVSDRTIRNYWTAIQDALSISDDPEKDTKVLIGIEARKLGLID